MPHAHLDAATRVDLFAPLFLADAYATCHNKCNLPAGYV